MHEHARILCVDDEANVLAALQRQLRGRYDVVVATGADAALEQLASQGPFDVVVSDLHMPGCDGLALLARVREQSPRTAAILMSGSEDDRVSPGGADDLVAARIGKPCRPEELWAALDEAIAQRREDRP
jgi:DNA-binding NtrC family response regulator